MCWGVGEAGRRLAIEVRGEGDAWRTKRAERRSSEERKAAHEDQRRLETGKQLNGIPEMTSEKEFPGEETEIDIGGRAGASEKPEGDLRSKTAERETP
ncbi:hypothetical protein NDU88_005780 [Pleurodeles waltl]|uniref:Uncharacterized protein n=1 Tax=Pleurodeles waltl TaxID=8319 RepID=A0AAV7WVN0_PLEWA|nr:hypothetical protein NDU88_005780 [Pleurodeles waltl]